YAKLLLADPSHAAGYNSVAWVWATSPDASRRDGKKAVQFATKACELSGWKKVDYLSTLAAAYAECGEFTEAVIWQNKAVALTLGDDAAMLRARLESYKAGKAYRDK